MKRVIIENYIIGLGSFLDEQDVKWEGIDKERIIIYYNTDYELFQLGFEFGRFYESIDR